MLTPYPKPKKLSDPFQDWMGCDATLSGIVAKEKADLGLSDYNVIFARNLPAATYEEGAYYLDGCFELMRRKASAVESNICESLFWFIDFHRDSLREDGLLEPCLQETAGLFQDYLLSFEMLRLSDGELTQYRIDPDFREMPRHTVSVWDLLDFLVEYDLYSAALDSILVWLSEDVAHKSCWWVELAYHVRSWYVTYDVNDKANARKQAMISRLLDLRDYSFHRQKQMDLVRAMGYWQYERRVSII